MTAPLGVRVTSPETEAMPKSVTTTRSPSSRMLAGLMSRCTMPAWWATASAAAIWAPIRATCVSSSGVPFLMRSARDGPLTSSITIHGSPSSSSNWS